ncbi:MAG TPA: hypothetical protein PLP27_04905 [Crocinitomicaceae bacterium]|nr:hypothetical protein [Crocinitomicaceae bacterium]
MTTQNFPQYRKHKNGKNFYKINHAKHFDEIQLIGTRKLHYTINANQYPEMVRIMDMLNLEEPFVLSDEKEWSENVG